MSENIFDCSSDNLQKPLQTFTQFFENQSLEDIRNSKAELCGATYYKHLVVEEIDTIVRIIRKHWCYIQNTVLNETTTSCEFLQTREIIAKCLNSLIVCLKYSKNEAVKERYISSSTKLKTLIPLIVTTSELDNGIYLKIQSTLSNKDKCPVYQYFHTFQDVQYYLLLFYYTCEQIEDLESHVTSVMKDLVFLSQNAYKHKAKTAFICDCNKHFWLIIQILCEKVLNEDSFWLIFNKVVENFDKEYVLWLLHDVANLQAFNSDGNYVGPSNHRIKPNFILLESALKDVVSGAEFNSSILSTVKSLEPLLCNLWLKWSKIEVYQILWDFFSKRLNVCARSNTDLPLTELVDLIDTILWTPKDCDRDFELFLAMLAVHLNEHSCHWGKMKGRIYSQLGPNKIKDLNNRGVFNVLLLFLSLTKANFNELSKKFMLFVENLSVEKKQSHLIWNFYTALVVRHLRENRDIEDIAPPFIKMLEDASTDQKSFNLIKTFVQNFDYVVNCSSNLQLHQWLLINTWIHKYMTSCYYQDLITLLNTLLNTIEQIRKKDVWCDWESSFKNYVYPALQYSRSTPDISGTLAGKIAVLSPNLLSEAFTFFNSENTPPKISANFLCVVLENYPNSIGITTQQEALALQTWIKFCLLTRDSYEDLTKNIVKLDTIPEFIKTAVSSAKDPFCALIECISSDIKRYSQSSNIIKLCEVLFGQAERWITQYFSQPENEAVVLRIFTCFGLSFFKIGPLLYDKHKSNCPFARLVTALLLPKDVVMGKPLNAYILQSIKKTWHLFFGATVKLNSPNDVFIDRILREMIMRYIPHFATVDSPMLKCLDNEITAEVVLDKISTGFFRHPTQEADSNIFKALKLIGDFAQSTTSVALMRLVINKTLYGLFEVVIFHNQRNMAVSVVKNITMSLLFPDVKSEFEEIVVTVTEKHLAFNTPNYFQLLGHLSKFVPTSLKSLMPRIKQHVSNVERMRGVGYDKTLRLNIERLEASLLKII